MGFKERRGILEMSRLALAGPVGRDLVRGGPIRKHLPKYAVI